MFEDVPGSFCGTSSSPSESMGLRFFAFGKSLGFSTSGCLSGLSFLCGDLERSLTRLCGSTAADSSSVYIGTCTGARSRDLDLCRLSELPEFSSGTVNGPWITVGCIGCCRDRSRDTCSALALSFTPAGGGAGSNPGGSPRESGGL